MRYEIRSTMRDDARASERGFALVVALLALVGVTVLGVAGYLLSNADYRINQSHRAATQAFYVADAGLEAFMGAGRARTDTLTYSHPDGSAEVWSSRLLDIDAETSMYRITSRGTHAPAEGGVAQKTISTVAILQAAPFNLNSAFTAPPGLQKNGVSGTLSGYDTATPADCGLSGPVDVAGVSVPDGGLSVSGGGKGGGGGSSPGIDGDPPVHYASEGGEAGAMELLGQTGIAWESLRNGSYAEADYVYSQDSWPSFNTIPADEYPFIVADQASFDVNSTRSGRGTLVVHGDLDVDGAWNWDGIVLVGGTVTSNGNNHVAGAVVGGLNMLLGEDVDEMQLGNGTWDYQYHSCNVIWALKSIGTLAEQPGTWSEAM